jgi:DNA-binding transcriptional LysR family regulator
MLRPHLNTFLTVCETGSFNKAANALYITPSAVLQQIQTLEADLEVTLFIRQRRGVTLTSEGEYLLQKGKTLRLLNDEIHRDIQIIGSKDRTIYVGTSIMEKCRLLYDLWVLFSETSRNCEIQMLNIDAWHRIPDRTDLVESVYSNNEWEHGWKFYEICKVPFGFAVANNHPLSGKKIITIQGLLGQTVLTLNTGSCTEILSILNFLKKAGLEVVHHNGPEVNPLWESGFRRDVLLIPLCWRDILINTVTIPFEKEFLLPYGIFYRPEPHGAVKSFLEFIFSTYGEGNTSGIVPVLD